MSRVMNDAEMQIPIEELPKSLIVTSFDGHLLEMDVNRFNGKAFVKYPVHLESLKLVSRIFAQLEAMGFIDDVIYRPEWVAAIQPKYMMLEHGWDGDGE